MVTGRTRGTTAESHIGYNNCAGSATVVSRRPSQAYSQVSVGSRQSNPQNRPTNISSASSVKSATTPRNEWTSYRTDVTGTSLRTPITSGKFRTAFSYRKAEVPEGYPKMDYERNPRRESTVAEFSRKLAEGYDIWDDDDRPIINWKYPHMPSRPNRTQELRTIANLEKINRMLEREKQMNKRLSSRMMTPVEKKETAWWERPRNGHRMLAAATNFVRSNPQNNRAAWSSSVSHRYDSFNNGIAYTPRR